MAKSIEGIWHYEDGTPVTILDCREAMDVAIEEVKELSDEVSGHEKTLEALETIRDRFQEALEAAANVDKQPRLIIPGNGGKFRM